MATFIGNLEMINSQIEELGARSFSAEMVISNMLSNLPAAYDTFQTMWKGQTPTQQTLSNLQTWLLDEERVIRRRQSENAQNHTSTYYSRSSRAPSDPGRYRPFSSASGSMRSSAFDNIRPPHPHLSPEQHDSRLQRAQEIAARKQVSRCGNCGELGHWHKDCPRPSRRPAAIRQFNSFPSPTEPPASPAPGVFPSPQDSRSAAPSPPVMMTPPRAYMVQCQDQEVQPFDWLADSGSSHHMSDQRSWFTNFTKYLQEPGLSKQWEGIPHLLQALGISSSKSTFATSGSVECLLMFCMCPLYSATSSLSLQQHSRM
jgi:hypothetical protein